METQYITEEILHEHGIELDDEDKIALLVHLNEVLQERVGIEITESLSEDKLKELLDLQETGNEEAASQWLLTNVPNLEEIVNEHTEVLLGEISEEESVNSDV